jgi:hypothetical protein
MTGTLRDTIQHLAADFAVGVLDVIRGASLEDILSETEGAVRRGRGRPPSQVARSIPDHAPPAARSGRKARLQRRSAADIGNVIQRIVELLSGKAKGLRAEQIRAALGVSAKELPRPIALALSSKQITKAGQKRATTYYARGATSAPGPAAGGKGSRKGGKGSSREGKGGRPASSAKPASRASEATVSGATEAT